MYVVILSGGVGSRLWPVSRKSHPKPFIQMPNGLSILQNTFLRSLELAPKGILNVTGKEFIFKVTDEWTGLLNAAKGSLELEYILEPFGKNTAAAIAMAALWVCEKHNAEEPMLVLPADHMISDEKSFHEAVTGALKLASQGRIVTFGIKPNAPETGYGYIENDGNEVKRFIEKPSIEKAEEYLASGQYLWNSGMFCFKPSVILAEMEKHCSDILVDARACFEASKNKGIEPLNIDSNTFDKIRDESIDYAVLELSNKVSVIPCDIGWNDVGTWNSMSQAFDKDHDDNHISGEVILNGVTNCHIESKDRIIAAVGVKDLVIIDTADALLVANKACAQDVKNIYNLLAKTNHKTHELHITAHRPWGSYTILEESKSFKVKRIELKPGASLSLQSHEFRSEHWIVVAGQAIVVNGEQELMLNINQSTYIPAGNRHRLSNPSESEALVIIEVQIGSYLGEDDIQRFDDVYGRIYTN